MQKDTYLQPHKGTYKFSRMTTLAKRLKIARSHAKLTQKALAIKVGVEQPVISQIETGKNLQSAHLTKIAHVCGVNAIWLSDEIGPMFDVGKAESEADHNDDTQLSERVSRSGRSLIYRVPLISLPQILEWVSGRSFMSGFEPEMELPCPVPVGARAFAFRMPNDSMAGSNTDTAIQKGWAVFIDPDGEPAPGQILLASINGAEPILGVLTPHGGKTFVKPANSQYGKEPVDLTDLSWYMGRAVFAGFFL
jgi:SOS-response transcriptional repressor LexA